jgi:type II secretory pathway pseudopilin PulG
VLSYYSQAEPRSRLRGWLAQVWRVATSNASLISSFIALLGVLITLVVTTVVTQQECSRQHDLEAQRAKAAREVAQQQARQEALQTYLGDMGKLILRDTSPLREADPKDEVSRLARAKTLTVLLGLDAQSKTILLQFLAEEQLVQCVEGSVENRESIISLAGADLSGVYLLRDADLFNADLRDAKLSSADLSVAYLSEANLTYADLKDARGVTGEQLEEQAKTLERATMPNGQKYGQWLKSKGRGEVGVR